MAIDPFLPTTVCPTADGDCYVVRGRRVGGFVEITLSRDLIQRHRLGSDTYTPVDLLAIRRFDRGDSLGYMEYSNRLEDAARYAARGQLGYTVDVAAEGNAVRVTLVARLLTESGQVRTEISHERRFADPDSNTALVLANERAAELRALAEQLNDNWASLRKDRLLAIQAEYEKADADAAAAKNLESIVDAESE